MKRLKSLSIVLFLLASACGGKRTSEGVGNGSNTNWLSGCKTDAHCGNGVCASGACTEICETDGDCRHLAANARCGDAVPFVASSQRACDDVQPRRVCTRRCDDASDCADVGDGYTCEQGSCEPAACIAERRDSGTDPTTDGEPTSERPVGGDASTEPVPGPTSGDCSSLSANECDANGCVVIQGHPATAECEPWKLRPVGCAPFDSGDAAISCAVSPFDALCYQFPTTTTPSGWETVNCADDRCNFPDCPTDDCFSPTRNVGLAYGDDSRGCPCNGDGSACVEGVALMCENEVWEAVEDGPCMPRSDTCAGWLADVEECIALFDSCAMVDGKYCGRDAKTSLCDAGMLLDSQADCPEGILECREVTGGKWCAGPLAALCSENYQPSSDCAGMPAYACIKVANAVRCGLRSIEPDQCESEGARVFAGEEQQVQGCPRGFAASALLTTGGVCCVAASLDGGTSETSGE